MKRSFLKTFRNQSYIEQLQKIPYKFNAVHNEENSTTEITIYGVIGDAWFEESVSASDIDDALKEAGSNDIIINLNSPGGDAFDGISIYNRLKRHTGNVTIHVDGWACSAASIIALSADELIMGTGSMMMIHEASTFAWGKKNDLLKEAELLGKLDESLIDIYMTKSKVSKEEVTEKVENETWFTASETVEMGFADKAAESEKTNSASASIKTNGSINEETLKTMFAEFKNEIKNELQPKPKEPAPVKQNRAARLF